MKLKPHAFVAALFRGGCDRCGRPPDDLAHAGELRVISPVYALETVRYGTAKAPGNVAWVEGTELTLVVAANGTRYVYAGCATEDQVRRGANLRYTYHPTQAIELDGDLI